MAERISKIGFLPDAVQRKMGALSKSLKAGSKAVFDWGKKTKEAQVKVKPAIKETKKFAEVFNNPKKPKTGLNPVMKEADKKAEALKKQQDKLKESFAATLNPSKKLGEKLKVLVDEFDREEVVEAHWEQILKARDASVEHNTVLDPLVESMVKEAATFAVLATNTSLFHDELIDLNPISEEARKKAAALEKAQNGLRQSFANSINPSRDLGAKLGILMGEFDRETVIKAHSTAILAARDASVEFKTALDPLVASMVDEATALTDIAEDIGEVDTAVEESSGGIGLGRPMEHGDGNTVG